MRYLLTVDDNNRVVLQPLDECEDFQNEYINASYVDVRNS